MDERMTEKPGGVLYFLAECHPEILKELAEHLIAEKAAKKRSVK